PPRGGWRAGGGGPARGRDGPPRPTAPPPPPPPSSPPPPLRARLERRLPLLATGPRDAPPRHQTLQAAIAWSHALLAPPERALFRRLAVFAGGFTLAAAEAVCGPVGEEEVRPGAGPGVLAGIAGLVEQSLLQQPGPAGT